jgi:hypothetical protein
MLPNYAFKPMPLHDTVYLVSFSVRCRRVAVDSQRFWRTRGPRTHARSSAGAGRFCDAFRGEGSAPFLTTRVPVSASVSVTRTETVVMWFWPQASSLWVLRLTATLLLYREERTRRLRSRCIATTASATTIVVRNPQHNGAAL